MTRGYIQRWLRGFLLELLGDEAFRRRGELEPQAVALLVNAHARLQMSNPLLFELCSKLELDFFWVKIDSIFFWTWRFTTCLHVETQQNLILQDPRIILHKIFRAGFVLTIFNLFVSSQALSPNHEKGMKHYLQLGSFRETITNYLHC